MPLPMPGRRASFWLNRCTRTHPVPVRRISLECNVLWLSAGMRWPYKKPAVCVTCVRQAEAVCQEAPRGCVPTGCVPNGGCVPDARLCADRGLCAETRLCAYCSIHRQKKSSIEVKWCGEREREREGDPVLCPCGCLFFCINPLFRAWLDV